MTQSKYKELYHHGIKGQKWGKQNGPPYPLDYDSHSKKEKKLMDKEFKKSFKDAKTVGEAKTIHRNNEEKIYSKYSNSDLLQSYLDKESEIYKKKLKNLTQNDTDKGKKIVKALGYTAVAALAGYGIYKAVSNSNYLFTDSYSFKDAKLFKDTKSSIQYNSEKLFDDDTYNSLSDSEKNAIKQYTGPFYISMNSYLRGKKTHYNTEYTEGLIDSLESALDKMSLKEDVIAHRGIGSYNSFIKTIGLDESVLKNKKTIKELCNSGYEFVDPAFGSSGGAIDSAWAGVQMHIYMPKGSKAMYVDPVSKMQGEDEFIIQKGSRYRLKDAKYGSNGQITDIIVELINS